MKIVFVCRNQGCLGFDAKRSRTCEHSSVLSMTIPSAGRLFQGTRLLPVRVVLGVCMLLILTPVDGMKNPLAPRRSLQYGSFPK